MNIQKKSEGIIFYPRIFNLRKSSNALNWLRYLGAMTEVTIALIIACQRL